jgi:hypothetical protein
LKPKTDRNICSEIKPMHNSQQIDKRANEADRERTDGETDRR